MKKLKPILIDVTESVELKSILNEIDNIAYLSIGYTNTTHNFMTKYHENHSYDNCRLIKINEFFVPFPEI